MKRVLLSFIAALATLLMFAEPPRLLVEEFFDGRYKNNSRVDWSIIKTTKELNRFLSIQNSPEIIKDINEAIDKDILRGYDDKEILTKHSTYRTFKIQNNGEEITVGFSVDQNGMGTLFIKGKRKAFE